MRAKHKWVNPLPTYLLQMKYLDPLMLRKISLKVLVLSAPWTVDVWARVGRVGMYSSEWWAACDWWAASPDQQLLFLFCFCLGFQDVSQAHRTDRFKKGNSNKKKRSTRRTRRQWDFLHPPWKIKNTQFFIIHLLTLKCLLTYLLLLTVTGLKEIQNYSVYNTTPFVWSGNWIHFKLVQQSSDSTEDQLWRRRPGHSGLQGGLCGLHFQRAG